MTGKIMLVLGVLFLVINTLNYLFGIGNPPPNLLPIGIALFLIGAAIAKGKTRKQ